MVTALVSLRRMKCNIFKRKWSWPVSRHCPSITVKIFKNATKHLTSGYPVSNRAPSKFIILCKRGVKPLNVSNFSVEEEATADVCIVMYLTQ